jgi:hypothetical protein
MFSKLKLLGFVCALAAGVGLGPSDAKASSVSGKITSVRVQGTNIGIILTEVLPTGRPGCHDSLQVYAYAFDISTSKGRALLSLAQAALLSGKPTFVSGGSSCTNVGGTEDIETLQTLSINAS